MAIYRCDQLTGWGSRSGSVSVLLVLFWVSRYGPSQAKIGSGSGSGTCRQRTRGKGRLPRWQSSCNPINRPPPTAVCRSKPIRLAKNRTPYTIPCDPQLNSTQRCNCNCSCCLAADDLIAGELYK